jgi:hypothetical protein
MIEPSRRECRPEPICIRNSRAPSGRVGTAAECASAIACTSGNARPWARAISTSSVLSRLSALATSSPRPATQHDDRPRVIVPVGPFLMPQQNVVRGPCSLGSSCLRFFSTAAASPGLALAIARNRDRSCAWRIPKFVSILRPCRGLGRIVRCASWLSLFCICWRQSPGWRSRRRPFRDGRIRARQAPAADPQSFSKTVAQSPSL